MNPELKARLEGLRVLVVEDDATIREGLIHHLKGMGMMVRGAENGEEGLAIASRDPHPDLIISDVNMPLMSGIEMCQKIKKSSALKGIPVVFLSTMDDSRNVLAGMRVGAVDYLSKINFRSESILRVFERILMPPGTPPSADGHAPWAATSAAASAPDKAQAKTIELPEEEDPRLAFILRSELDVHMGLLRRAGMGLAVFNLNRELVFANKSARSKLGMSEPERPFSLGADGRNRLLARSIEAFESGVFKAEMFTTVSLGVGGDLKVRLEVLTSSSKEIAGVLLMVW